VLVVQEGNSRRPFQVKITDFGLSKEVGDGMSAACSIVGSPKYVAPEVLALGTHDFKADLWSLGVLLFVLLGNRFPFNGNSQAARETEESIHAELRSLAVSDAAHSVMLGLLRLKADERLTLAQLSNHGWLNSVVSTTPKAKRRKLQANVKDSSSPTAAASAVAPSLTPCPGTPPEPSAASCEPVVVDIELSDVRAPKAPKNSGSSASGSVQPLTAMAIASAATPRLPKLPKELRRRSWVDCTPEENEKLFNSEQDKLKILIERGFESVMAEVALNAADGNVDTAIMMLEG